MEQLPTEILHEICKILPTRDLQSFRLCCPLTAAIGASVMLPVVRVICSSQSIDRLEAIASHATVGSSVHTLVYCAKTLPKLARRSDGQELIDVDPLMFNRWPLDVSRKHVSLSIDFESAESYQRYSERWEQQARSAYQRLESAFENSVKKLSNLRNIELEYGGSSFARYDEWEFGFVEQSVSRKEQLGELNEALALKGLLKGASHLKGKKLQKLQVIPLNLGFLDCNPGVLSQLNNAVQNLQEVQLRIFPEYHGYGVAQQLRGDDQVKQLRAKLLSEGRLRNFLAAMPKLQKLNLECAPFQASEALELGQVIGNVQWTALSYLQLSGFDTPEADLVDLIKRHAPTLRVVYLINIMTYDPVTRLGFPTELSTFQAIFPDTWKFKREADRNGRRRRSLRLLTATCASEVDPSDPPVEPSDSEAAPSGSERETSDSEDADETGDEL